MAKSIKELKKENEFLKSKCEKSDFTLIELVEEVWLSSYLILPLLKLFSFFGTYCWLNQAAWEIKETIGEVKESKGKAWVIMPNTTGREEAKLNGEQQLWFSPSLSIKNPVCSNKTAALSSQVTCLHFPLVTEKF